MAVKINEGKLVIHKQRCQWTLIEPQDSRKFLVRHMNPGGVRCACHVILICGFKIKETSIQTDIFLKWKTTKEVTTNRKRKRLRRIIVKGLLK